MIYLLPEMICRIINRLRPTVIPRCHRLFSDSSFDHTESDDERFLREEIDLTGINLDPIDLIIHREVQRPTHHPSLEINHQQSLKPVNGHNVVVIQPWSHVNYREYSGPEFQLAECVSLGNTIHNWNVIGQKIVFASSINRLQIVPPSSFDELKDIILSHPGVSAVFFGLEVLSGSQLTTLERELKLPVYDRFTVVLNIIRQHARTKEAKIQLALAELPYIRENLREIHESSESSSSAESLKMLIGGTSEKMFHVRMSILKRREHKLRYLLQQIYKQRDLNKKQRKKSQVPTVSVVGYTNSGKTSLIKYLTNDQDMQPKDQLFATLDVSVHAGQLPSSKEVYYLDTVGFLSRIPSLLVEAFSATLKDINDSDLILHVLDITHQDFRLQYSTVMRALETLAINKRLLDSKITIGNKVDLLKNDPDQSLPKCHILVSSTEGTNMVQLSNEIDSSLMNTLNHKRYTFRVPNGGQQYNWLRKYGTMVGCEADLEDANFLLCEVVLKPSSYGRYIKYFGGKEIVEKPSDEE